MSEENGLPLMHKMGFNSTDFAADIRTLEAYTGSSDFQVTLKYVNVIGIMQV